MTGRIWHYAAVVMVAVLGASMLIAAPAAAGEGGSFGGVDPEPGMDVDPGFGGSPPSADVPRGDADSDPADGNSGSLAVVNEVMAYKVLWSGGAVPSGVAALAEVVHHARA